MQDGDGKETREQEQKRTVRDLRVAIIFGFVMATIQIGVLVYFMR